MKHDNRTENVMLRVTPQEKENLRELSKKHRLNMSEYLRAIVFENSELSAAVAKEAKHQLDIYLHVLNNRVQDNTKGDKK